MALDLPNKNERDWDVKLRAALNDLDTRSGSSATAVADEATARAQADAAHAAAENPHPQYLTLVEASATYATLAGLPDAIDARSAELVARASEAGSPLTVYHSNGNVLVRSKWSATRDLLMPFALNGPSANGNPRIVMITTPHGQVSSIAAGALDGDVWPTITAGASAETIHIPNDDVAPLYVEGYLAGGNHTWSISGGTKITVNAHGKTNADRGSQWTDGTNTYTLARIIDANNILFLHNYQDLSGGRSRPVVAQPAATLTHVSGATNTDSVAVTTKAYMDLPEIVHSRTVDARVDGFPLIEGTMTGTTLTITEAYTIATFKGIVLWSRANIGADPFTEAALSAATALCRLTNTFTVTRAQVVVGQSITALSPFAVNMGVTQATAMTVPAGGTLRQFMPGVGTVGGFNLSTFADVTTVGAIVNIALADQLVAADPATRMVQWAHDSGGARKWGQAVGLLPVVDGKRAARRANGTDTKSWWFSTLKKNYPQIAQNRVLATGQTLTGRAFRRYLHPTSPPELLIEDAGRQWLMIDTPTANATEQTASVPKAIGRTVVPDGTSTVTLADNPVPGLTVGYTNTAPGYLLAEAVIPD